MYVAALGLALIAGQEVTERDLGAVLLQRLRSKESYVAYYAAVEVVRRGAATAPLLLTEFADDPWSTGPREGLRLLGTRAFPVLSKALDEPALRRLVAMLLVDITRKKDPARESVADLLKSHAIELVPELLQELGRPRHGHLAVDALALIGPSAVSGLIESLHGQTHDGALSALYQMGPPAAPAIPILLKEIAATPGGDDRVSAAYALGAIGAAAEPALIDALSQERTRFPAALALIHMKSIRTADLLPVLINPPPSETPGEARDHYAAFNMVWGLGLPAWKVLVQHVAAGEPGPTSFLRGFLVHARRERDWMQRNPDYSYQKAHAATASVKVLEDDSLPAFLAAFERPETRSAAAAGLAMLGTPPAMEFLEREARSLEASKRGMVAAALFGVVKGSLALHRILLVDPDASVRDSVIRSLLSYEGALEPVSLELLQVARGGTESTCPQVAGPVSILAAKLKDRSAQADIARELARFSRWSRCTYDVRFALATLFPASLDVLLDSLRGADGPQGWFAVAVFETLGSKGVPAAAELALTISFPEVDVRRRAAAALAGMGAGAAPATESLLKALGDVSVRWTAATILGNLGTEVVPPLVEALGDPARRTGAAVALSKLGPRGKAALPALLALQTTRDPDLLSAVTTAISNVSPIPH